MLLAGTGLLLPASGTDGAASTLAAGGGHV